MAYALGLDFGTLSCRAFLLDLRAPGSTSEAAAPYLSGVMDEALADGTPLEGGAWALQDAADYLRAAEEALSRCLPPGDPRRQEILGIGVDCTASSPMPTDGTGRPLSASHPGEPHAYVKLWKHHRAEPWVSRILAEPAAAPYLSHYGGQLSCEWLVPKAFEMVEEAGELWHETDCFVEAGDWIVRQLTGRWTRNLCAAGFKGMWNGEWPDAGFLRRLHPDLASLAEHKLRGELLAPGQSAGGLCEEMADRLGLPAGIPVSAATIDAHSGLLGMGIRDAGSFGMIMGTSACQLFVAPEQRVIPGVMGVVRDGILPGLFAYEAGQAAVGDLLSLYLRSLCPAADGRPEAELHEVLAAQARAIPPGSNGHLVLDWVNGNRSILLDPALSGAVFGLTLDSKPAEIYRACLEATAFGCRVILDSVLAAGVAFHEVVACGGLTRNASLMQIYADVLGLPVRVSKVQETVAMGAAMYGAMAAGSDIADIDLPPPETFEPDPSTVAAYEPLFREYLRLHDHFGRDDDCLRRLRSLREV